MVEPTPRDASLARRPTPRARLPARLLVVLLATLSLAACGSGGGEDGRDRAPPGATGGPGVDLDGLARPDVLLITISGHANSAVPLSSASNRTYLDGAGSAGPKLAAHLAGLGLTVVQRHIADRLAAPDADGDGRPDQADRLGFVECLSILDQAGRLWIDGQPTPTSIVIVSHSHGGTWAHMACEAAAGRLTPGPLPVRVLVSLDAVLTGWDGEHDDELMAWWDALPNQTFRGLRLARDPSTSTNAVLTDQGPMHVKDVVWPSVRFAYEVMSADPLGALLSDVARNVALSDADLATPAAATGTTIWTRDTRAGQIVLNGVVVAPPMGDGVAGEDHGGVHDANGASLQWVCDRLTEVFAP